MVGKRVVTKAATRLIDGTGRIERTRLIPSKPTEWVDDQY
jgi:hypothetical protein